MRGLHSVTPFCHTSLLIVVHYLDMSIFPIPTLFLRSCPIPSSLAEMIHQLFLDRYATQVPSGLIDMKASDT